MEIRSSDETSNDFADSPLEQRRGITRGSIPPSLSYLRDCRASFAHRSMENQSFIHNVDAYFSARSIRPGVSRIPRAVIFYYGYILFHYAALIFYCVRARARQASVGRAWT